MDVGFLFFFKSLIVEDCESSNLGLGAGIGAGFIVLLSPILRDHNFKHVLDQFHFEFEVGLGGRGKTGR